MELLSNCFLDDMIGPLQSNTITIFFGPPAAGKTTICFQYAASCVKQGKRVIYVDTEGGFSPERVKQIDSSISLQDIIVLCPKSFEEQNKAIFTLNKQIKNDKNIGLIIVDSLAMLYRLKLGDNAQAINKELAEQLRLLTELSRSFNIPILVVNQMYKHFDTQEKKMIGGTMVEYWSKTSVLVNKEDNKREVVLKKHKFKKEGVKKEFEICDKGII